MDIRLGRNPLHNIMTQVEAAILGLVQGLTEFLPVSSSGHLVLVQVLGVDEPNIAFEIVLHLGTLFGVIFYFWRRLWRMIQCLLPGNGDEFKTERKWIGYLAVASIPAAIVGFSPLKGYFTAAYDKPVLVGGLLVTGTMLFLPRVLREFRPNWQGSDHMTLKSAIFMGVGQALRFFPGVSRSGSTIVSGMISGVNPKVAAEFSFLMALPAIAAASVIELSKLEEFKAEYWIGGIAAFGSGMIAILTVMTAVRKGKFEYFGILHHRRDLGHGLLLLCWCVSTVARFQTHLKFSLRRGLGFRYIDLVTL